MEDYSCECLFALQSPLTDDTAWIHEGFLSETVDVADEEGTVKELHSRLRDSASDFVADRETLILLRVESTKPCTCALISLFFVLLEHNFCEIFSRRWRRRGGTSSLCSSRWWVRRKQRIPRSVAVSWWPHSIYFPPILKEDALNWLYNALKQSWQF